MCSQISSMSHCSPVTSSPEGGEQLSSVSCVFGDISSVMRCEQSMMVRYLKEKTDHRPRFDELVFEYTNNFDDNCFLG